MRARFLLVAFSTAAFASPPTAEHAAQAGKLKAAREALAARITKLAQRNVAADAALTANEGKSPRLAEIRALTRSLIPLERDGVALAAECKALNARFESLGDAHASADADCRNGSASMSPADCTAWGAFDDLFPPNDECQLAAEETERVASRFHELVDDLKAGRDAANSVAAKESLFRQPISGTARERAIDLPPSYVTFEDNVRRQGERKVDTLRLFTDVHPSHFVFLRGNVAGAPRNSGESVVWFWRTLKKGEAVLPLRSRATDDEVTILSIDGHEGVVRTSSLALAPLAGTRAGALVADDLTVRDEKGTIILGPTWLGADATGFFLDESTAWLGLLDPPEPRSQRFYDAKEKVLGCYTQQMARLDPSGKLRKDYDVVSYGRAGVSRVESAESNFDRQACRACGCKTFNALKQKLMTTAMTPAQKKLFGAYAPVLEKLNSTDFSSATKGAPAGKDDFAPQPL